MLLDKSLQQFQSLGAGHTAAEITQQPNLWRKLIHQLAEKRAEIQGFLAKSLTTESKIIFTGAGSSEFVGNTVVPYLKAVLTPSAPINKNGQVHFHSISSTDLVLAPKSYISSNDKVLLVSCARSGNSPESVAAARLVESIATSCYHLVLTCDIEGKLAQEYAVAANSYVLELEGANDQGFAMTGSFSCMTLAGSLIFQLDQLATFQETMNNWLEAVETYMTEIGQRLVENVELAKKRIICLGSAENKGIAQEAHLKMLELSASHNVASFDSPLGFRHGPKSVLNAESIIFFFCSSDLYTSQYEVDMLRELMVTSNGVAPQYQVIAISPQFIDNKIEKLCHCAIIHPVNPLPTALGRILSSLLHIVTAQMYALQNSLKLGVEPDNPSPSGNVNRVVQGVKIYPYQ